MSDEEELSDWIQPDGGLYSLGAYIAWTPGESTACLDGHFTAEELLAVGRWMVKTKKTDDGSA